MNTKHIKAIDKSTYTIFMTNNEICYASKRYLQKVLTQLLRLSNADRYNLSKV
ncbi:hypothetical protein KP014_07175 [Paenibacillus sophorae]|uniref:LytTr DNA-binding domain-containing protein n=1 Tax=Paenibacillus sophorae TaxID=1333845 RepID=A0ABX8HJU0_9BACL|nr:hypothetical protein KP014_07175 [Paenibacillus sophorae]